MSSRSVQRRRGASLGRFLVLAALIAVMAACGGDDRDPIRVQAATIDGQVVIVDDLADRDTMLWFWAPW